ncbi:hypothetical protein MPRM_40090 [Mycobacterium parmense]|uniref:Uncharacterized protein n=1 Tax=Mycobacterium parmense TaxID=185642 RepID=A0A7I7YXY2_9MYCO|nr:hypothetical protein MPRM_40090 [Mycobacterium parmense]
MYFELRSQFAEIDRSEHRAAHRFHGMGREREPGVNPGLSRSGIRERPPSSALGTAKPADPGKRRPVDAPKAVRARESEDLLAVPDTPCPAAHRPADWADVRVQ